MLPSLLDNVAIAYAGVCGNYASPN